MHMIKIFNEGEIVVIFLKLNYIYNDGTESGYSKWSSWVKIRSNMHILWLCFWWLLKFVCQHNPAVITRHLSTKYPADRFLRLSWSLKKSSCLGCDRWDSGWWDALTYLGERRGEVILQIHVAFCSHELFRVKDHFPPDVPWANHCSKWYCLSQDFSGIWARLLLLE